MNKLQSKTEGRTFSVYDMHTGRIDAACSRYDLGKGTMRKVAEDAGAIIRIGKIYLINFSIVDAYLDSISQ